MGLEDRARGRPDGYPTETSPLIARPIPHDSNFVSISNGTIDTQRKEPSVYESEIESQSIHSTIEKRQLQKNLKIIFPAVAIGIFLSAADQTLIVSSYSRIGSELNALSQTSWIAVSMLFSSEARSTH